MECVGEAFCTNAYTPFWVVKISSACEVLLYSCVADEKKEIIVVIKQ